MSELNFSTYSLSHQIDSDEVTVENALTRNFDQVLRLQLDPIWHQLGPKARQLVSDLKTLRLVLRYAVLVSCTECELMVVQQRINYQNVISVNILKNFTPLINTVNTKEYFST